MARSLMNHNLRVAFLMVVGSYIVCCGRTGLHGGRDGSLVTDARADPCCTTLPPMFTKLAEGDLTTTTIQSPPIAVGGYRELVVYSSVDATCMASAFRPDPNSRFGYTNTPVPGRIQVQGSDLSLLFLSDACASTGVHYIVAGVQ